ncbi:hypothetical protein [Streptomyces sp. GS7]|nr:hypothetical protein [Streptomyces sp. GS7]QHC26282.1 hypothetical protein GR130_37830 [Streptomyces sp. GS7]
MPGDRPDHAGISVLVILPLDRSMIRRIAPLRRLFGSATGRESSNKP